MHMDYPRGAQKRCKNKTCPNISSWRHQRVITDGVGKKRWQKKVYKRHLMSAVECPRQSGIQKNVRAVHVSWDTAKKVKHLE